MLQYAHTLVSVHNVYALPNEYLSNEGQRVEECHEGHIAIADWLVRNVIDFHTVGHIAHAAPGPLKLVGNKGDLVAPLYQTLPQLISVGLDASEFWEGKVCANENAVFLMNLILLLLTIVVGLSFTLRRCERSLRKFRKTLHSFELGVCKLVFELKGSVLGTVIGSALLLVEVAGAAV